MDISKADNFTILAASLGYSVAQIQEAAKDLPISEAYARIGMNPQRIVEWLHVKEYNPRSR